jgi:hypothetical protein
MMASPGIVSFPEQNPVADGAAHCTRLVLAVYTAVMASSRNEGNAFNAAVQTYRSENPDAAEDDARRAVAEIICRKP